MELQKLEELKVESVIAKEAQIGDVGVEARKDKTDSKVELSSVDDEIKEWLTELRELHLEYINQEEKFQNEILSQEMKYAKSFEPLLQRRKEIVNEGIPDFWLKVLLQSDVGNLIENEDKAILRHLSDVSVKHDEVNFRNFALLFHFEPNDYFYNSVLTKEYEVTCSVDPKNELLFRGPKITKCKGCEIEWKEGKGVTSNGDNCKILSFFQFFSPSILSKKSKEELEYDFEMGKYIKEQIIPGAAFYYTGEVPDEYEKSEYRSEYSSSSLNN